MKTRVAVHWLLTAALSLLLLSCGSTRHAAPSRFDLSLYGHVSSTGGSFGSIVLASHRPRDCEQEQIDCVQACMKRRLPSHLNHIKRVDGSKQRFCERECLDEYMDCLELQKSRVLQFTAVDDAVEWLKRNRKELLVGTIVVIAGVAFVTLSAGAGAVILAPVVLLAA